MLCEGNHFVEDKIIDGKFEQIVFYISAEQIQQNLVSLLNNYGIECNDSHQCHSCRRENFVKPIDKEASGVYNNSRK